MDDSFAREVLRLAQGQDVECYDNELKHQAQQLGIPLPAEKPNDASKPTSTLTCLSETRRSISGESQASQSTGLTSNLSRTSREHEPLLSFNALRNEKRKSTTAISIREYDSILSSAKHDYRRLSLNLSPPVTPSPSSSSLPLSASRESSSRRHLIRGLSRLRFHRRSDSSCSANNEECPHCPRDSLRHRRPSHTLPCGHRYCTTGVRKVIKTAMNSPDDVPPSCCQQPIPGWLVERVMNQDEQDRLMSKMVNWENDAASATSSANAHGTDLATVKEDVRNPRPSRQNSTDATDAFAMEEARQCLERAMKFPDFRVLREEQEDQRDRCAQMDRMTRHALSEDFEAKKEEARRSHEQQAAELADKHTLNLSQVEDKHVHDEMNLRDTQAAEARNTATALRHMEAFCRGETTSGDPHHRDVSAQDRGELAKTRHRAAQLDKKHDAEISVLRGEQARRMAQRIHRQDLAAAQLEQRQKRELEGFEEQYGGALHEWECEVEAMRERLRGWWFLRVEIWRKMLEAETGILFEGAFPPMDWPDEGSEGLGPKRRDTLGEEPGTRAGAGAGAVRSSEGASPRTPASDMRKEIGFSTAFAVRGSVVGRA